jgi:hypothetical protein
MLVGFIGAPISGKTTIAAKMFSTLKEQGNSAELIVEEARHYIARYRYSNKLSHKDPITLTDDDQLRIASKQKEIEEVMKYGCGFDTIIVSDSSIFNTALYLSNGFLDVPDRPFFKALKGHYDVLFYCHPIPVKVLPDDPNRIHDLEHIKRIQEKSVKLLNILKGLNIKVVELLGSLTLEQRYQDACSATMDHYLEVAKRV